MKKQDLIPPPVKVEELLQFMQDTKVAFARDRAIGKSLHITLEGVFYVYKKGILTYCGESANDAVNNYNSVAAFTNKAHTKPLNY